MAIKTYLNLPSLKLAKSFSVYAIAMIANAVLSFATFSLITHHLTEAEYGIINLYGSFTIFIVPFIGIGVQFTLNVDYFKMDPAAYRIHFANGIIIPVISCCVMTVLFLIFHNPLQHLTKANFFFVLTLPFSCLLIVLNEIILYLIRNKEKAMLYAGYTIAKNLVEIGLTILLVVILGYAWKGRLTSALVTLVLCGITVYYFVKKWNLYDGVFRKKEVLQIVKIGFPFIPERLAVFFLAYSDRFFIDHYRTTSDVGDYSTGAQIASIVTLSILTLISTFHPYIFKSLAGGDLHKVRKATLIYIGISFFVAAAVILATPFLFKYFVGHRFQSGQVYARNLSIGLFFWSIYTVFMAFLLYLKKNKLIMLISLIGIALSIILNLFNVQYFGAIGATYSSMIVNLFMAVAGIVAVNKFYNLKKVFFPA